MLYCCKLSEIILTQFKLHERGLAKNCSIITPITLKFTIKWIISIMLWTFLASSIFSSFSSPLFYHLKAGTNYDL